MASTLSAAVAGTAGHLAQQGALADTAGAADVHDAGGRVIGVQALVQERDLPCPGR